MTSEKIDKRLRRLLMVLVDEWGLEKVEAALAEIRPPVQSQQETFAKGHPSGKKKLRPHEIVDNALSTSPKKTTILELAHRFESKSFLPTIGDVREFFSRFDRRASVPINRSESFRAVLKVLLSMQDSQLVHLRDEWAHSGPSELKPLSDAINTAAQEARAGRDGEAQVNNPTGPTDR